MDAPRATLIVCVGVCMATLASAPATAKAGREATQLAGVSAMAGSPGEVEYHIGPLDKLDITVFEVSDLSIRKLQVDASGRIILPLIGEVVAQGRTTTQLAAEIAARLGEKYLQSPQVSVTVEEALSRKVTVEGAVNEAGVFEMKGRTSLLEAVARAKGASKAANLHRVSIVRIVDGEPHAATFDLAAIGAGRAPNPEVVGDDVVIVDSSRAKSFWNGLVQALPVLYVLNFL